MVLRIAQPALSRQVRKLEEELQQELCGGRTLEPMPASACSSAKAICSEIDLLAREVKEGAEEITGVAVGLPPGPRAALLVPRVAGRCAKEYPGISLSFVEAPTSRSMS